jgi:CDP-6-deoxy-D-xylo-4-hexulose-3-dehydrase
VADLESKIQEMRAGILNQCREFFVLAHAKKPFIPGETYIPATVKSMDGDDLSYLIDASLDMWLTAGRFSKEFEAKLPHHFGRKVGSLLVNSGSSANLLAVSSLSSPMLTAMKLKPLQRGDEVITAAAGFPTTVNPILQNGWTPVFVDVDLNTLNVRPEAVMAARTPKTRAVVLAHTLGNPYRADLLAEWCREEGLYLVEDCCDALGSTIEGAPVGSFGDYATISFYPAHHITMGEGGAVMSRNAQFRRIAESMRDWGRDCWCDPGKDNTCGKRFEWTLGELPCGYDHKYTYSNIGYNLKVTDMQAALGVSQLSKIDRFVAVRRANWRKLNDRIRSSSVLDGKLTPVEPTVGTDPSWFGFAIHCAPGLNREKITPYLEKKGVGTRLLFAGNLTKQPAYRGAEYRIHGELKATDKIMSHTFWIGVHPALDDTRISYMVEQLEAAVRQL